MISGTTVVVRMALAERLRERLPEIQAAVATRVYAISDPHDVSDPGYPQGLDSALAAAVEYRLDVLEAERAEVPSATLRRLLGEQAALGDRLIAAVSAEYTEEAKNRPRSSARGSARP